MKLAAYLLCCGLLANAITEPPTQAIFEQAVQALTAGDYPAAEHGFQRVLQQEPRNVGALGNLGILYARTNRIDKAIAEYQQALRLSPNDEAILLNLGLVYFKEELHSRASTYFARVLTIDRQNQQARQLLDVCRLHSGAVDPAIRDLQLLQTEHPADQQLLFLLGFAYLKTGDAKTAQTLLNQMLAVAGPARAQFLFGKASYEAALFPQAEQSFLETLRLDPQFPGIHRELGKVFISERRNDEAILELKQELSVNQNDDDANYFLGSLLVRQNQGAQAVPYLEKAMQLKPDSYGVYLYLGKAKLRLGAAQEAVQLLQKAVELEPDDATAQYTLARALKTSGQDAAAKQAFARVYKLNGRALNESSIPGVR
jgi:tetratricopeptide (TPR) repeat protein